MGKLSRRSVLRSSLAVAAAGTLAQPVAALAPLQTWRLHGLHELKCPR
jgi:TAT (twin-arginine translocation) pathway signal sequence